MSKSYLEARGNALFLILIAVALFAALSYAVTHTGRGSGTTARETQLLTISQAMQTAAAVEQAVVRLRIGGCNDTQISFAYDSNGDGAVTAADDYHNPSSPADGSCHVFGPNGSGMSFPDIPPNVNTGAKWVFSSNRSLSHNNDMGYGADSNELVMMLPDVDDDFCLAFNKYMQTSAPLHTQIPVDDSTMNAVKFNGTYICCDAVDNPWAAPAVAWWGADFSKGICFKGTAVSDTQRNWFMYVLLDRQP